MSHDIAIDPAVISSRIAATRTTIARLRDNINAYGRLARHIERSPSRFSADYRIALREKRDAMAEMCQVYRHTLIFLERALQSYQQVDLTISKSIR